MEQAIQAINSEIEKLQEQIIQSKTLMEAEENVDMRVMLEDEIKNLEGKIAELEQTINTMEGNFSTADESSQDSPINPNVAILEVRAGAGGDEAGLFASELYNMYLKLAEKKHWKVEEIFTSENGVGGFKTASVKIAGKGVYTLLGNESGTHRVQRVPKTESAGRIHTSTATVAVLPELKKVEIEIKPEDLKWDFFRSGGKGGQNVNKVSTAVRVMHIPTGTIVECQEGRTQGKNREKALSILESRLYTMMQEQKVQKIDDLRTNQVGTGDRSEKIRTYNFPQNRVTDHRVKQNWHNIESLMTGNIEDMLGELGQMLLEGKEGTSTE